MISLLLALQSYPATKAPEVIMPMISLAQRELSPRHYAGSGQSNGIFQRMVIAVDPTGKPALCRPQKTSTYLGPEPCRKLMRSMWFNPAIENGTPSWGVTTLMWMPSGSSRPDFQSLSDYDVMIPINWLGGDLKEDRIEIQQVVDASGAIVACLAMTGNGSQLARLACQSVTVLPLSPITDGRNRVRAVVRQIVRFQVDGVRAQ